MKLEIDNTKPIEIKVFIKEKGYVFLDCFSISLENKLAILRFYGETTGKEKGHAILSFREKIATIPLPFKHKDDFQKVMSFIMDILGKNFIQEIPNKIGKLEITFYVK